MTDFEEQVVSWMRQVENQLGGIQKEIKAFCRDVEFIKKEYNNLETKLTDHDIRFANYNGRIRTQYALLVGIALGAGATGGGVMAVIKMALGG